jgi:hypothetical protein
MDEPTSRAELRIRVEAACEDFSIMDCMQVLSEMLTAIILTEAPNEVAALKAVDEVVKGMRRVVVENSDRRWGVRHFTE